MGNLLSPRGAHTLSLSRVSTKLIVCWSAFDPIIQVQLTCARLIKCEMGKGGSRQRSSGEEKA